VAELRSEPLGWAGSGARIFSGETEITQLKITAFKSRGSFVLDGKEYEVVPKGFFQTSAELKQGSRVMARVRKPSFFKRRFEITSAGHRIDLESRGWRARKYVLLLGNQEVGSIEQDGFSSRRLRFQFPDEVPVVIQVLLAYLVIAQAKREAAAAAGA
jgi:hypothetical protein